MEYTEKFREMVIVNQFSPYGMEHYKQMEVTSIPFSVKTTTAIFLLAGP